MEKMRGDPLQIGTLEEMIDDNHAIVSGAHGPEYYTTIMSFVDKDQLEPGSSILMNNKSKGCMQTTRWWGSCRTTRTRC